MKYEIVNAPMREGDLDVMKHGETRSASRADLIKIIIELEEKLARRDAATEHQLVNNREDVRSSL